MIFTFYGFKIVYYTSLYEKNSEKCGFSNLQNVSFFSRNIRTNRNLNPLAQGPKFPLTLILLRLSEIFFPTWFNMDNWQWTFLSNMVHHGQRTINDSFQHGLTWTTDNGDFFPTWFNMDNGQFQHGLKGTTDNGHSLKSF